MADYPRLASSLFVSLIRLPAMTRAQRAPPTTKPVSTTTVIDPLKVAAQRAAAETGANLVAHGFTEMAASRGESAYVADVGPFIWPRSWNAWAPKHWWPTKWRN